MSNEALPPQNTFNLALALIAALVFLVVLKITQGNSAKEDQDSKFLVPKKGGAL